MQIGHRRQSADTRPLLRLLRPQTRTSFTQPPACLPHDTQLTSHDASHAEQYAVPDCRRDESDTGLRSCPCLHRSDVRPMSSYPCLSAADEVLCRGRCADDLQHAAKTLIDLSQKLCRRYDLVPIPWRDSEENLKPKLKFGYFVNGALAICMARLRGAPDGIWQTRSSRRVRRVRGRSRRRWRRSGRQGMRSSRSTSQSSKVRRVYTNESRRSCAMLMPSARAWPVVLENMELFVGLTSADGYETLQSGLHGDPRCVQ